MNIHLRLRLVCAAIAIAAVSSAVRATITEPDNHKVIFRYRCFSGTQPSYVSPLTTAGGISHASGSSDIITTDRGAGFDDMIVTDFDGASEFVQGASSISTVDSAGNDSFTVEAWFKADSVTGTRKIFSNTESNHGFALFITDGRLQGVVRFKNGTTPVSVSLPEDAAYASLNTGQWYYAVLHCRKTSSNYELRLYLDGTRVAYLTSPLYNGVYQSTEKPMIGAEPSAGAASGDYFDGQIYAVVVSNHDVYLDNYVKVAVARDGGRYFGVPSYHDYLDTTASNDFRIQATCVTYPNSDSTSASNKVVDRIMLPFLNDGYNPQGVGYDAVNHRLYVSYYWHDSDGSIGDAVNNPDKISIVAELDATTRSLRRVFRLYNTSGNPSYGHVGGLTYYNDALYVSYGTSVYRYPLASAPNPNYIFDPATFANPRMDQNPLTVVTSNPLANYLQGNGGPGAFSVATDSDGSAIFWSAGFDETSLVKLLGFRLNADGSLAVPAVYSFTLPVTKVQGLAVYSTTSTDVWCYLSTSYGDTTSVWKRVHFVKSTATAQSTTTVFSGPAGTEGLATDGSSVWSVSESCAKYYQKRTDGNAQWDDLYPFIFKVTP
jgi:hypothetical protein